MRAIKLIKDEHKAIDDVVIGLQKEMDPDMRRKWASQLIRLVREHTEREETVLYPLCARFGQLRPYADRALEDHQLMRDLSEQISDERAWSELDGLYDELIEVVERHIDEEETELFPKMEECLDDLSWERLALGWDEMAREPVSEAYPRAS